jgi:hypothetical protein
MEAIIHSIREAIELPLWALPVALVFVLFSPLFIKEWRRNRDAWHKSDE